MPINMTTWEPNHLGRLVQVETTGKDFVARQEVREGVYNEFFGTLIAKAVNCITTEQA